MFIKSVKRGIAFQRAYAIAALVIVFGLLGFFGLYQNQMIKGVTGNVIWNNDWCPGAITTDLALTKDLIRSSYLECIRVAAPNLTVDCQGKRISFPSVDVDEDSVGIYVGQKNTTIKNCIIDRSGNTGYGAGYGGGYNGNTVGVLIYADNCSLLNSRIEGNVQGVVIYASKNHTISGTVFSKNQVGLTLGQRVNGSRIVNNSFIFQNRTGVYAFRASGNLFENNIFVNNSFNFSGRYTPMDMGLTFGGAGLFLLENTLGNTFFNNSFFNHTVSVYVRNSSNQLFLKNRIGQSSFAGFLLNASQNSTFLMNTIFNSTVGINMTRNSIRNNFSSNVFDNVSIVYWNDLSSIGCFFYNTTLLPLPPPPPPPSPSLLNDSLSGALFFNGSDQYAFRSTMSGVNSLEEISVSLWFLQNSTKEDNMSLLSMFGGDALTLYILNRSRTLAYSLQANSSDADIWYYALQESVGDLSPKWHNVILIFNGFNVSIYVDGILAKRTTFFKVLDGLIFPRKPVQLDKSLVLGAKGNRTSIVSSSGFLGTIDEVRIYSRALSIGEVSLINQSGRAASDDVPSEDIFAWYALDDARGNHVQDRSGEENTLTLIQGPQWVVGPEDNEDWEGRHMPQSKTVVISQSQLQAGVSAYFTAVSF